VTLKYEFDIFAPQNDQNQLWAMVTKRDSNPQANAIIEGYLTGSILLNQTGDLVAESGMNNAVSAAGRCNGCGIFTAMSGNWSRYNTGSHVDMSGLSLMTGLSRGFNLSTGCMTLGTFFELGNGSCDTFNSFANAANVYGNGSTDHIGGGLLGRWNSTNTGFYTEGSLRAGCVKTRFDSDLFDSIGTAAGFRSSSPYYGLHVGSGYLWNTSCRTTFDLYSKYFWTRQDGNLVTLSTGEQIEFGNVDSHRLRVGGRSNYAMTERINTYFGAAWEYEFDGRARATTNGLGIDAPSLRGNTGLGEVGLSLNRTPIMPLALDFGVQGYVGKREGIAANLQVRWER